MNQIPCGMIPCGGPPFLWSHPPVWFWILCAYAIIFMIVLCGIRISILGIFQEAMQDQMETHVELLNRTTRFRRHADEFKSVPCLRSKYLTYADRMEAGAKELEGKLVAGSIEAMLMWHGLGHKKHKRERLPPIEDVELQYSVDLAEYNILSS